MKFKKIICNTVYFILVYLSAEILVRRNIFSQIPTQIPYYVVYLVLTINLLLISRWLFGYLKVRVHKTMQDKN